MSTIREIAHGVIGGQGDRFRLGHRLGRLLRWPPDVFAVTSTLLWRSGAYRFCVSRPIARWPITRPGESWARRIERAAALWSRALARHQVARNARSFDAPATLRSAVHDIAAVEDRQLRVLGSVDALSEPAVADACLGIIFLHAAADSVCAGWGIPHKVDHLRTTHDVGTLLAELTAEMMLVERGSLSTLDTDLVRVLPKTRTPRAGISIRSLSHHLAVYQGETKIEWMPRLMNNDEERRLNLLLFPWSEQVRPLP